MIAALAGLCSAQGWTEAVVIEKFLDQSPQAREARARVAIAEASARGRGLYANPSINYSHEGAGRTDFFQAEQILPVTGRLKLLRQAGTALVRSAEAEGAFSLWHARSSLRQAFYRVLAAQQRETIYTVGFKDIENVLRVLANREREGEGSKFDRLRTERERAELLAELALIRAETSLERAQMFAFLPRGSDVTTVSGQIETPPFALNASELAQRALAIREDYRAEQRRLEQYRLEQRAAERLRFPEPVLNAGLKRAEVAQRGIVNGPVVGITIPLPLFNQGQTEVARYSAEQERASARLEVLSRQIRSAVEGTIEALNTRQRARDEYRNQLAETGPELIRIATVGPVGESFRMSFRFLCRSGRAERLVEAGAAPAKRLDEARTVEATAEARLRAAETRLAQYDASSSAETNSLGAKLFALRAPISGIVIETHAAPHANVKAGETLFKIVDLDDVYVSAIVPEAELPRLRNLSGAELEVPGSHRPRRIDRLISIGRVVDPASRTYPVIYALDNRDRAVAINQTVHVRLLTTAREVAPTVPESSIVDDSGRPVVFIQAAGETFLRKPVQLGIREGGYVQVLDGIFPGERVVTRGAHLIRLAAMSNQVPAHGHVH